MDKRNAFRPIRQRLSLGKKRSLEIKRSNRNSPVGTRTRERSNARASDRTDADAGCRRRRTARARASPAMDRELDGVEAERG